VSHASQSEIGTVQSLWRCPVKSMMGEALSIVQVNSNHMNLSRVTVTAAGFCPLAFLTNFVHDLR